MSDKHDDDERVRRLERMRQLLKPITSERARQIGEEYTKHMRESVERPRQQRRPVQGNESND